MMSLPVTVRTRDSSSREMGGTFQKLKKRKTNLKLMFQGSKKKKRGQGRTHEVKSLAGVCGMS